MTKQQIVLQISDDGSLKAMVADAEALNKSLMRAAMSASKVGGGTKTLASAKRMAGADADESREYGVARSAVGTGASARDFAKQAQGLGGLVHLYATFAANLFAAAAAFNALSRAMDATNMVKGLDQIGAASGRNLGTLAKDVQSAADGAISLRDSMEAVAKASSGGMSNKQILEMTDAAKKASQALGVAMPDAISRMTRGITKLEPELLDELGIMVRVDKATQDYARSVGKTVTSLTDFERRQAYANAVLKEAQTKFGAIQIDSNPYQKLLASITDLVLKGGELINVVLAPVAKFLSESPGALGAALAAVVGMLVKQAIPAFGAIRENAAAAADEAGKVAQARINAAESAILKLKALEDTRIKSQLSTELKAIEESANARVAAVDAAESRIQAVRAKKSGRGTASIIKELEGVQATDVTKEQLAKLDELGSKQTRTAKYYQDYAEAIRSSQKAEEEFFAKQKEIDKFKEGAAAREAAALDKAVAGNRALREQISLRDKAQADAASRAIKNAAVEQTYQLGALQGYRLLAEETKKAQSAGTLTAMQAAWTKVSGAVSIATAAVATFGTVLNNALIIVGILVTAYQILNGLFSKNSKEMAKFEAAVDTTKDASEGLSRTLDNIAKKDALGKLSAESITARATAFSELSSSIESAAEAFARATKNASDFDKFMDRLWGGIGRGTQDKLRDSIVTAITDTLSTLEGPLRDEYKKKIREVFGVDASDVEGIKEYFNSIYDPTILANAASKVAAANKNISNSMSVSAAKSKEAKDAFESVSKTVRDLTNSLKDKSPLAQYGESLTAAGLAFDRAMKDSETSLNSLIELTKSESALSILPSSARDELQAYGKELVDLATKSAELTKKIQLLADAGKSDKKLEEDKKAIDSRLSYIKSRFKEIGPGLFDAGMAAAAKSYTNALKAAHLTVTGAYVDQLSGAAKIAAQTELRKQEIAVQKDQIESSVRLVEALELSALEVRNNTRAIELDSEISKAAELRDPNKITSLSAEYYTLQEEIKFRRGGATQDEFNSIGDRELRKRLEEFMKRRYGLGAQTAALDASSKAATISGQFGIKAENFAENQKFVDAEIERRKQTEARAKSLSDIVGLQNTELVQKRLLAEKDTESLVNAKELAAVSFKLVQANTAAAARPNDANFRENVAQAQREYDLVVAALEARTRASENSRELQLIDSRLAAAEYEVNIAKELNELRQESASTGLSISENNLQTQTQLGAISQQLAIEEKARLSILATELQFVQQIAEAQTQEASELAKNNAARQKALQDTSGKDVFEIADIAKSFDEIDARILARSKQKIKNAQDLLNVNKSNTLQLAKQESIMKKMDGFAESLEKVFGDLGKSIGNTLKSIMEVGLGDEAMKKRQSDALWDAMAKGSDEYKKVEERNAKERAEFELDASAKIAGSAKSMFAEKTAAYKAFDAVEKTLHAIRLVRMVQETATAISSFAARVPAYITEIYAVATKQMGPIAGPVAATAAIAAIGLSAFGGGSKSVSSVGMTAKDRQETQGTGTTWKDGKKVETGGGVFGDSSAKSESIANSLEILKDNSIEGITYSSKMLNALKGIKDAIAGTAESLYKVAGIRTGSAFGTTEGAKTSGITGLFGKTTSKDIIDAGIKLSGTFNDLANKVSGTVQQYETVQTTTKKSGFLGIGSSTKTSINETFKAADQAIVDSISSIFVNATSTFQEVGAKLGMSAEDVLGKLGNVNVAALASLRDLKGEDLEKEFASVISSILDDASRALFSNMEKYAKFGEGMLETVVRVVDSNDKIKLAFDSIGKTYGDLSFDVTEALTDATEGLSGFLDMVSDYKSTFLTEAEQLIPVQKSVVKTMAELGYSTVDTRAEFKALVNSVDVTTASGRALWISLMEVADGFGQVTAQHQELLDEYKSLENDLLSTFRDNAAVKAALLARETEGMSDLSRAQYMQNVAMQEQIAALEQYYDLMDELDSVTMTATQLRAKERESIAASNRALFDYVNAAKDKIQAEEDMKTALEGLKSSIDSLTSEAESAAQNLQGALDAIVNGFNSATEALKNAERNVQSALQTISSGYQSALTTVQNAQANIITKYKSAADKLASAKTATQNALAGITKANASAAKALRDLSTNIKKFIESLSTNSLSTATGAQKLQLLDAQFSAIAQAARGGDQTALKEITSVAQSLLQVGQEQASSSLEYASLFSRVTSTLLSVSSAIDAAVGPAPDESVDNEQSQAIAALAAAQSAQSEAEGILAKWTEVAGRAGIKLEDLVTDPMEEFKDALSTYTDATEALKKWKDALDKSGASANMADDPVANALKAYFDAVVERGQAASDLEVWQALIAKNDIDIEANTKSTAVTIGKYFEDWKLARTVNEKAQTDLKTALEALKLSGIDLSTVETTTLSAFQKSLSDYNTAKAAADSANAILTNTNLASIKGAIESMASSIVAAVSATKTVVIERDPTVPAANDDKIPDAKKLDVPNASVSPGNEESSYISSDRWMQMNGGALGLAQYQANSFRLDSLRDDFLNKVGQMPSFDVGSDYIPKDMIARVHEGEKIIPAKYNGKLEEALIQEVRNLRQEVSQLKAATNGTEENTRKTKQMLEQVTLGNNYIMTKAA